MLAMTHKQVVPGSACSTSKLGGNTGRRSWKTLMERRFDTSKADAMAMPVTPVEPKDFDLSRYSDWASAADQRFEAFLAAREGIAVWQRVRVAEVFGAGCRDAAESLRWQLGGLTRSLDYLTDAPGYLEPWYGIGTIASAFGAEYEWPGGLAPVVRPPYRSVQDVPELVPREWRQVPIMRHTIDRIGRLLEFSGGRIPISWSDLQGPLNVLAGLVDTGSLFTAFYDAPQKVLKMLAAVTDASISFTQEQSRLIGTALARPGHGFASSRAGRGIGLSVDNLIMVSPDMYAAHCAEFDNSIGHAFGGTGIHSCGNWARWIPAVKRIPNLTVVDGAFSPETDPAYNGCEEFQAAFSGTGVAVQARIVGDAEEVISRVKRLWGPGMKLIVVTHEQDPIVQHRLYHEIQQLCA